MMNSDGINKGQSLTEIKTRIDEIYQLDVPYPILKKLVNKIASEFNNQQSRQFVVHQDGSFIIKDYIFTDYEAVIMSQEAEIEVVDNAYREYLILNNEKPEDQPSIF